MNEFKELFERCYGQGSFNGEFEITAPSAFTLAKSYLKAKPLFVIVKQGDIFDDKFFVSNEDAREYLKSQYPRRRFKEDEPNKLICAYYGTIFRIKEVQP